VVGSVSGDNCQQVRVEMRTRDRHMNFTTPFTSNSRSAVRAREGERDFGSRECRCLHRVRGGQVQQQSGHLLHNVHRRDVQQLWVRVLSAVRGGGGERRRSELVH
jgi:hypothetical protein